MPEHTNQSFALSAVNGVLLTRRPMEGVEVRVHTPESVDTGRVGHVMAHVPERLVAHRVAPHVRQGISAFLTSAEFRRADPHPVPKESGVLHSNAMASEGAAVPIKYSRSFEQKSMSAPSGPFYLARNFITDGPLAGQRLADLGFFRDDGEEEGEEPEPQCGCVSFAVHGSEGKDVACAPSRNVDGTVASTCVAELVTGPELERRANWKITVEDDAGNPSGLITLVLDKSDSSASLDRFTYVWGLSGRVECGETVVVKVSPRMAEDTPEPSVIYPGEEGVVDWYQEQIDKGPKAQMEGSCWIVGYLNGVECGRAKVTVSQAPPPPPPPPKKKQGVGDQMPHEPGLADVKDDKDKFIVCDGTVSEAGNMYGRDFWWSTPRTPVIPTSSNMCNAAKNSNMRLSWNMNEGQLRMIWDVKVLAAREDATHYAFARVTYVATPTYSYPVPGGQGLGSNAKAVEADFLSKARPGNPTLADEEKTGGEKTMHLYFRIPCETKDRVRLNFVLPAVTNSRIWDATTQKFVPTGHGTKYHDFEMNYSTSFKGEHLVWDKSVGSVNEQIRACTSLVVPTG